MVAIDDFSELAKIVHDSFPEYTLVRVEDYENSSRQSYKFLYEELCAKLAQSQEKIDRLEAELFTQNSNLDLQGREFAKLEKQLEDLKAINESFTGASGFTSAIENLISGEIIICSPDPVYPDGTVIMKGNDLRNAGKIEYTSRPAVYDYKRPSFFSPLGPELTKENAAAKMASRTAPLLEKKLLFWDKLLHRAQTEPHNIEKLADEVDVKRSEEINKLLQSKISNEEKYVKYLMLTPGIKRDYLNTLMGAAELSLDANIVIRLLEQPAELFNREVFEQYVSYVHKGTEYNLKRELAEELIRDEWSVRASVNGKEQLFRLVPYDFLCELKDKLIAIENLFSHDQGQSDGENKNFAAEPCANLAQGSAGHKEEIFFEDEEPEVTVDDAMIDMMLMQ